MNNSLRKKYLCLNCGDKFKTIGAWKRHMGSWHGGYTEEQIAVVSGTVEAGDPASRIREFAAAMPESAEHLGEPSPSTEGAASQPATTGQSSTEPALEPEPEVKRVKATPKKLKKLAAQIPEQFFKRNGITLDDEDKEAVEEAVEFLENVFGVQFEVPAEKTIIRSRIWALLWPIGVMAFIYIKHKAETLMAGLGVADEESDHRASGPEGFREKPSGG